MFGIIASDSLEEKHPLRHLLLKLRYIIVINYMKSLNIQS